MATTHKKLGPVVSHKVSGRSKAQAARTRVLLDKQLGDKTPASILRLAKKAPLKG